ncbi:Rossmann-fold NAD(P)-binding domain-containing protein [Paenibacillus dendritiformis]|uniref:hypothetical protein n=1 Tax=Paenibacillus dendritiformis TaxID=130049 RepID=UPI00387E17CF
MCSSLAVAWVHRQAAPRAIRIVMNKLDGQLISRWRLFPILGGSANLVEVENAMDFSPKCEYHQVQLGFVVEQSRTRWLTHSEIAGGVIEAMMRNQAVYTMGTTHPPELRPST